ncbi:gp53-like domain-containing protein [Salinicola aestuarinus]|uniref:gp53-like domain-containing protein n=1 Tax=Salinicola aestuarinus TaxID=1949082 RepID=UPI000DA10A15|nr:hypothetical protein [Salinicola aestuarinus]
MSIQFTITDAGRAALIDADHDGTNALQIAEVALGRGRYTPSPEQTELREPIKRIDTIAGEAVAADTLHVTVQDEGGDTYSVGEIGLITDGGVLFGVTSQSDWIIEKAEPTTLLLATDVVFASLDVSTIQFGDAAFLNPPATTEIKGIIEIATQEEVDAGNDRLRAVVPRTLKALIDKILKAYATVKALNDHSASRDHPGATTSAQGMIELATYGETQEGGDNTRAVTPAALNARTATTSRTGLVKRATDTEANAGTDPAVVPSVAQVFSAFKQFGLGVTTQPTWPLKDLNADPTGVPSGIYRITSGFNRPGGSATVVWTRYNNGTGVMQLTEPDAPTLRVRGFVRSDWSGWFTMWSDQNMGSGSGMDADKLDGQHGDFYRNADNLTSGTVPLARLTSATETDRGILQIATSDLAKAGSNNARIMTPARVADYVTQFGIGENAPDGNGIFGSDFNTFIRRDIIVTCSGDWQHGPDGNASIAGILINLSRHYTNQITQIVIDGARKFWRSGSPSAGTWDSWRLDWNNQNHGAGSGMDADLLDGQHGDFYRDAGNLKSGTVPLARLTSATETDRGILQIASFDEAVAGWTNGRTMTPLRSVNLLGSFGIGINTVPTWPYASMSSSPANVPSGIYRATSNVDGKPAGSGTFLLTRYSSAQASVFYMEDGTSEQRIFRRRWTDDNGWSSWVEIVHSGMSDQSLTATGYCKMPNGLILQWGTHDVDSYETFPVSFPNNCASVVLTDLGKLNTGDLSVFSVSNSGFRIHAEVPTSGGAYYMAIGY